MKCSHILGLPHIEGAFLIPQFMNIDIQKMIYKHLTVEQMTEVLKDMEKLAKTKHYSVCQAYSQNAEDGDNIIGFAQLIDDSKWENFLPSQYHTLKYYRDEQEKQAG